MARKLPDEVHTLAEYQELIDIAVENDQERYDTELAKARSDAEAQWQHVALAKAEEMLTQAKANIDAEMKDGPNGPEPLSEAEKQAKLTEAEKEIDAQLAKEKQDYIQHAESMVEQAKDVKYYEDLYGFMKAGIEQKIEQEKEEEASKNVATGFSYDAYYRLGDGQLYSVADARFITARSLPADAKIITIQDTPEQFKEGVLRFYKNNGFPDVVIGPELLTLEEFKEEVLKEIDENVAKSIYAGFNYTLQGERSSQSFHFSFKEDDQLNFANMANAANLLLKTDEQAVIEWQGWPEGDRTSDTQPENLKFTPALFLDFYVKGALTHLNEKLAIGREYKKQVRSALTKDKVMEAGRSFMHRAGILV